MRILGRADLAQAMSKLYDKLDTLYREIVNRSVVTAAVNAARSDCNDYFLALEDYKRELLDSPSKVDRELAGSISRLNNKLRTVREVMGQLVDILRVRDASPGSRRAPSGFERRHGAAESAIESILPDIRLLALEFGGAAGLQEQSRRRYGDAGRPGNTGNGGEYRQQGYREPGSREYRRMIS